MKADEFLLFFPYFFNSFSVNKIIKKLKSILELQFNSSIVTKVILKLKIRQNNVSKYAYNNTIVKFNTVIININKIA